VCVAVGMTAMVGWGCAQTYPARPIRLVIPFPPGGSTDMMFRPISERLSERLGQPVVLDNRGGAGGTIGTDLVAKAKPDGYTLLVGIISPMAVNVELFAGKLPYDPRKDFTPISMVTKIPVLLTVHPSLPARNLKELVALARKRPHTLTYGSAGIGTTNHLTGELLKLEAGIDIIHIPFKGAGPGVLSTIAGETDMLFSGPPNAVQHVRTGRVRAISITGNQRLSALPEVPTMGESGFPRVEVFGWYSLVGPAGLSRDIVERLRTALIETIQAPTVVQQLLDQGAVLESSTPDELQQFIDSEITKWSRVVKFAHLTVQ